MGELAPFVLPATGGGAILTAFIYLLRYVSQLHKQLGEAQAEVADAATARAEKLDNEVTRLQLELAAARTAELEESTKWASRAAAANVVKTAFPSEYRNWKFFEARIDEALRGGPDDRA